jgi:hypothetical protein
MNQDFRDLLAEFNARGVEYLVVGAHALAAHGHVRATEDLDVWVRPDAANASRVFAALAEFGAPLHDLTESDLAATGTIFQIGVAPIRIDVITSIDGSFSKTLGPGESCAVLRPGRAHPFARGSDPKQARRRS